MSFDLQPSPKNQREAERWLSSLDVYLDRVGEKLKAFERLIDLSKAWASELEEGTFIPVQRGSLVFPDLPPTNDDALPEQLRTELTKEGQDHLAKLKKEEKEIAKQLVSLRNSPDHATPELRNRLNKLLEDKMVFFKSVTKPLFDYREQLRAQLDSLEDTGSADSPADIVAGKLTGKSFELFDRLRKSKRFVSFERLREDVWGGKNVEVASIKRALERLNKALDGSQFTLEFDKSRVKLVELTSDK